MYSITILNTSLAMLVLPPSSPAFIHCLIQWRHPLRTIWLIFTWFCGAKTGVSCSRKALLSSVSVARRRIIKFPVYLWCRGKAMEVVEIPEEQESVKRRGQNKSNNRLNWNITLRNTIYSSKYNHALCLQISKVPKEVQLREKSDGVEDEKQFCAFGVIY